MLLTHKITLCLLEISWTQLLILNAIVKSLLDLTLCNAIFQEDIFQSGEMVLEIISQFAKLKLMKFYENFINLKAHKVIL